MNFELFLLMAVQKYPALYDKNDVGFANESIRSAAYENVISECKRKFYTVPAICTKDVVDKFAREILSGDPKGEAATKATATFENSPTSFETTLEELTSHYKNLWDKSDPKYGDLNARHASFSKIAEDLKKAHPFLAEFVTTDFVDSCWKTKVKIIEESSLCSVVT